MEQRISMDVTKIPFNSFIGLRISDKSGYLLMLDNRREYRNHLDTVHASALFALAEATGGHFLLSEFSDIPDIIPVVRKVETKYRKPVEGVVFSKARFRETEKEKVLEELNLKGRTALTVDVSLSDETGAPVMQSLFEWFVTKKVNN